MSVLPHGLEAGSPESLAAFCLPFPATRLTLITLPLVLLPSLPRSSVKVCSDATAGSDAVFVLSAVEKPAAGGAAGFCECSAGFVIGGRGFAGAGATALSIRTGVSGTTGSLVGAASARE